MSGSGERRIAMIVALDAAGYSHQSEVDEQAAIEAVTRLRERVSDGAAAHGGHIFNSAGDGFMLEFASASGALAFSEEILMGSRVPVRAGAHLGEVTALPDGDLLGHGVNVAARLLALATPGELLASADVKRALPPAKGARFERRGEVQLEKMQARIEVMRFAPAWRPPSGPSSWLRDARGFVSRRRRVAVAIGASTLTAAALAAYLAAQMPAASTRVLAVLPFDALSSNADAQFYADGVSASIANTVSAAGVPTISPTLSLRYHGADKARAAHELGVLYVIDGDVRRDADQLHLSWHMDDARTGNAVLTRSYDAPAGQAGALSDRAANDIAELISGYFTRQSGEWRFLPGMARFIQLDRQGDSVGAFHAAREVAQQAPNVAQLQSMLGVVASAAIEQGPLDQRRDILTTGRAAARRAQALAPRFADGYLAQADLTPPVEWAAREALMRRALGVEPASTDAPRWLGDLLYQSGRLNEAAPFMATGLERDPISSEKTASQLNALIAQQRWADVSALLSRATRLWPDDDWVAFSRYNAALFGPNPGSAVELFDDPGVARLDSGGNVQSLQQLARAYVSRRPGDIAAITRRCVDPRAAIGFRSRMCMLVLASVGRLDEAFLIANRRYPNVEEPTAAARERRWLDNATHNHDPSALFEPQAAPMRADRRFAPLVAGLGLVDYWRSNGAPDFCATERAPVCAALAHH